MATDPPDTHFDLNDELHDYKRNLATTFNDPDFSDLTIKTTSESIHVHKHALCVASEWFRTALKGRFKERTANELHLLDDDPRAIRSLLEYIYKFDYFAAAEESEDRVILFDAEVFVVAEKYLMPGLQKLAADNFMKAANSASADAFAQGVRLIYTEALDSGKLLRPRIIQHVLSDDHLLQEPEKTPEFLAMLSNTPAFATDLALTMAKTWQEKLHPPAVREKTYKCPCQDSGCGMTFRAAIAPKDNFWWNSCRIANEGPWLMKGESWELFKVA